MLFSSKHKRPNKTSSNRVQKSIVCMLSNAKKTIHCIEPCLHHISDVHYSTSSLYLKYIEIVSNINTMTISLTNILFTIRLGKKYQMLRVKHYTVSYICSWIWQQHFSESWQKIMLTTVQHPLFFLTSLSTSGNWRVQLPEVWKWNIVQFLFDIRSSCPRVLDICHIIHESNVFNWR